MKTLQELQELAECLNCRVAGARSIAFKQKQAGTPGISPATGLTSTQEIELMCDYAVLAALGWAMEVDPAEQLDAIRDTIQGYEAIIARFRKLVAEATAAEHAAAKQPPSAN